MRTIRFGKTDVQVSAIAIGTWAHGGPKKFGRRAVGWGDHDPQAAKAALLAAYENGITHWDTADVYGDGAAEKLIGTSWSSVPRDRIFLASKVGWDAGTHQHFYEPSHIEKQLNRSLRLLNTDFIDLYYLHHCDFGPNDRYLDGAIERLRGFRKAGKIRFIGLSDWSSSRLMQFVDRVQPDAIQPYRNVVDDEYVESGLRDWATTNDVGVAFFSPLKHGLLLGKHESPPKLEPGDMRSHIPEFSDREALLHYKRSAQRVREKFPDVQFPELHALTGALLAGEHSSCVLVGQRSRHQAAAAGTLGDALSEEDAAWVSEVYRR